MQILRPLQIIEPENPVTLFPVIINKPLNVETNNV